MCVQDFIHTICGHVVIQQDLCDEALALDLPLFVVAACPNYQIHSKMEYRLCGDGGQYCAETLNGKCMYDIQHALQVAEAEERRITSEIGGHRAAHANVLQHIASITGSAEAFNKHPDVVEIWKTVGPLYLKKAHIAARKAYLQVLNGDSAITTTATDPPRRKRQVESPISPLQNRGKRNRVAATDSLHNDSLQNPRRPTLSAAAADPFSRATPSPRLATWSQGPGFSTPEEPVAGTAKGDSPTNKPARVSSRKRKAAEAAEEASSIRRSARVSKKKVNYAESSASDRTSRESSAGASSDGTFSPPPPLVLHQKPVPQITKPPQTRIRSNASPTAGPLSRSQVCFMSDHTWLLLAGNMSPLPEQNLTVVNQQI